MTASFAASSNVTLRVYLLPTAELDPQAAAANTSLLPAGEFVVAAAGAGTAVAAAAAARTGVYLAVGAAAGAAGTLFVLDPADQALSAMPLPSPVPAGPFVGSFAIYGQPYFVSLPPLPYSPFSHRTMRASTFNILERGRSHAYENANAHTRLNGLYPFWDFPLSERTISLLGLCRIMQGCNDTCCFDACPHHKLRHL